MIRIILFFLLASIVVCGNVFAWGTEKYCIPAQARNGECKSGDIILLPSPKAALMYCDFNKRVVSYSRGDASDIDASFICYFLGEERHNR